MHVATGRKMMFLSLVTLTFDIWPWPSNSSKRRTKHVFCVNLAQNPFSGSGDISYTNKAITDHTSPALCTPVTARQCRNGPVCCCMTLFASSTLQCIVNGDIRRKPRFLSVMILTFDLWPWPSNSSERGTKHVFRVNLAQIRSAVPDIFHTRTKKSQTWRQKQNLTQFTASGNKYSSDVAKITAMPHRRLMIFIFAWRLFGYDNYRLHLTRVHWFFFS